MSPTITSPALMTTAGVVLGTAAYMSPEQAKGREADKRSDLWAFGCVLYEMLTGQRAFDGEDMTDVLGAVVRLEPDWQRLPADVPRGLREVLHDCLVKDRKRRLADIAAVRFVLDHLPTFAATAPARAAGRPWRRAAAIGIGVILAAAAAGAVTWLLSRPDPPRVVRTTIATPPSAPLLLSSLGRAVGITPDGTRVVYDGQGGLFVRPLDGEPTALVRGSARAHFVSPDGKWVGFFDRGVIKKIAITGGPIETVTAIEGDFAGGAWATDGTLIFATARPGVGLFRLSPGDSTPKEVTTLAPNERAHVIPSFLPGDAAVLYTIIPIAGNVENAVIALLDLRTLESKRLIPGSHPQYVSTGHIVYTVNGTLRAIRFDPDAREVRGQSERVLDGVATTRVGVAQAAISGNGSLVYVPGAAGARRTIVSLDRQGNATPLPNLPGEVYRQVRVSPDGTRFAASAGGDIRIYDFARASVASLTTDPALEGNPLWSRDQRRIFYSSFVEGYPQIFTRAADGTGSATLLLSRGKELTNLIPSAWASDTRLVFTEVSNNLMIRIGLVDIDHPNQVTMLPMQGGRPSVSQYGIAYESNASGQFEIFVERFPQLGNREKIGTGRDPRWSADGRELFFVSENGREIFSVKVTPGPIATFGKPQVAVSAGMIPIQGGDSGYDLTPTGFVVIRNEGIGNGADAPQPTIELIQNWTEEVKRMVPR